jgi:dTDP-4-amino-4,6-dideoxygalactose transaminase
LIPFLDLAAQYEGIRLEVEAAVLPLLASGRYVSGAAVSRFEERFAERCGTRHAVAVNTGTSALHLALLANGIGPGDEVITVPMTFVATVAAILYAGAKPVLVDVDPETWTMDPSAVEAAITDRTRAIMPVHLHGRVADMDPILAIACSHGLTVIEDAAQAHGALYRGRQAGSLGDVGCFSFYPGKNLGACGEGGALTTDRDDVADRARRLRDWGQSEKYRHDTLGFNYRMDEIQGAILDVKLARLEHWTAARRELAAQYDGELAGLGVGTPLPCADGGHVYHVYSVRTRDRDGIRAALAEAGIATGIHYPTPVHLQPGYAGLGHRSGDFPISERLASEFLSLPIYPEMPAPSVSRVARSFERAVSPCAEVL